MIALLLMLGALAAQRPDAGSAPRPVLERSLTELRARPATHLGAEVRFTLQFRGLVEDWNPYLSRFQPERWLELEVWPDEVFTWNQTVFERPVGRLFLRRGGGFEPLVRRARTYQRFEVRARVREVFLGEPWIELLELVPLEGEVGAGTILHVNRAREFLQDRRYDLALEQYERARSAPLPPHALKVLLEEGRAVEELRARAAREHGNPGKGAGARERGPDVERGRG